MIKGDGQEQHFGDNWWHQINVIEIKEEVSKGRYPKIIKRVGASPPQYADLDESVKKRGRT